MRRLRKKHIPDIFPPTPAMFTQRMQGALRRLPPRTGRRSFVGIYAIAGTAVVAAALLFFLKGMGVPDMVAPMVLPSAAATSGQSAGAVTAGPTDNLDSHEAGIGRLSEYAATLESLLPEAAFAPMNEAELAQAMDGLVEPISGNYEGIGRKSAAGGYVLLTTKPGRQRLPQSASTYTVSPGGTMQEEVHVVYQENEQEMPICVLPLGVPFQYFAQSDVAVLYTASADGEASGVPLQEVAQQVLSGDQQQVEYLIDAQRRGVEVLRTPSAPHLSVSMVRPNGSWTTEHLALELDAAASIEAQLKGLKYSGKTVSAEKSSQTYADIGIEYNSGGNVKEAAPYRLQMNGDTGEIVVRTSGKGVAPMPQELYKTIVSMVRSNTPWQLYELNDIHDIVKADIRIRFKQDQPEQTQQITDPARLAQLEALFTAAKGMSGSGCPFTGELVLTRGDGEQITLHLATDSCDSMVLGTSVSYDYGPGESPDGEGSVNKQQEMISIFDQIKWAR